MGKRRRFRKYKENSSRVWKKIKYRSKKIKKARYSRRTRFQNYWGSIQQRCYMDGVRVVNVGLGFIFFYFLIFIYFIFEFLFFILNLNKSVWCDMTCDKGITSVTRWSQRSQSQITQSCNIKKNIKDSEINNVIYYSNNMLIL